MNIQGVLETNGQSFEDYSTYIVDENKSHDCIIGNASFRYHYSSVAMLCKNIWKEN